MQVDLASTMNPDTTSPPPEMRRALRDPMVLIGVVAFVGGFLGLLLFASFKTLDEGAVAQGRVVVEGNRKSVQHLEGGIVSNILVRDGDRVEAGQVLIQLDQTKWRAELDLLTGRFFTAQATVDRLLSEQRHHEDVRWSERLVGYAPDARLEEVLEDQQSLFDSRKEELRGQANILRLRVLQIENQVEGKKRQLDASEERLEFTSQQLQQTEDLQKQQLASNSEVYELQNRKSQIQGEIGQLLSDIGALEEKKSETEFQIRQLDSEAQKSINTELVESQSTLSDIREQLNTARDVLERTEIRAPNDGVVLGLSVHSPGAVIDSGAEVLQLVPEDDRLVVEAKVNSLDRDSVEVGLPVRIRLSGLSARNVPEINGTVEWVSADAFEERESGFLFYLSRIGFEPSELTKVEGFEGGFQPGVPVEVAILSGERTFMDYLIQPIKGSLGRAFKET